MVERRDKIRSKPLDCSACLACSRIGLHTHYTDTADIGPVYSLYGTLCGILFSNPPVHGRAKSALSVQEQTSCSCSLEKLSKNGERMKTHCPDNRERCGFVALLGLQSPKQHSCPAVGCGDSTA